MADYKFLGADFKGISEQKWKQSYETWLILKEMGHELILMFRPNGLVTFGYHEIGGTSEEENNAIEKAQEEWQRRNSSLSENVKEHQPQIAGAREQNQENL
jgi:hypothetical protein